MKESLGKGKHFLVEAVREREVSEARRKKVLNSDVEIRWKRQVGQRLGKFILFEREFMLWTIRIVVLGPEGEVGDCRQQTN